MTCNAVGQSWKPNNHWRSGHSGYQMCSHILLITASAIANLWITLLVLIDCPAPIPGLPFLQGMAYGEGNSDRVTSQYKLKGSLDDATYTEVAVLCIHLCSHPAITDLLHGAHGCSNTILF